MHNYRFIRAWFFKALLKRKFCMESVRLLIICPFFGLLEAIFFNVELKGVRK